MTRQFDFKLNEARFNVLLNDLRDSDLWKDEQNSQIVQEGLFYLWLIMYEKNLRGRTRLDYIMKGWHQGKPRDKAILEFKRKYLKFQQEGIEPFRRQAGLSLLRDK